jgi:D-alanyl-D-alanine carboxypeptidase
MTDHLNTRMSARAWHRPLSRRQTLSAGATAIAVALGAGRSGFAQDATPPATTADEPAFPADVQLALQEIVDRRLAETDAPGALVGVWFPGQGTWLHAGGIGDLTTGAPVRLDDHVRIASITKTFVATVVLQLVDEDLIGLDDPLEDYVPGVPNGAQITIRQVLGMDAGIADYIAVPELAKEYAVNPLIDFGPDQILEVIRESTPDFAPGEAVRYSNSNYILLGFVIEAASGRSPEVAITERILAPLDLSETSFPRTPIMPEPYMHGYFSAKLGDPLIDVTRSNPAFLWTAGAIISTLHDMRTWAIALADGSLLTPATQQSRLKTRVLTTAPTPLGYGLGVLTFNGLIGHSGGIPGYSSWLLHDPATALTVVIVINRSAETGEAADLFVRDILALLLPDRFATLNPAATPVP